MIAVFLYTFLLSAIIGMTLLALKKVKLKDTVPMAPFAFLGISIQVKAASTLEMAIP